MHHGERLPRYEEVMLGSLGRLCDHIVLLKTRGGEFELSRSGRYLQKRLEEKRSDIPLSALAPDCTSALGEQAANALRNVRPLWRRHWTATNSRSSCLPRFRRERPGNLRCG